MSTHVEEFTPEELKLLELYTTSTTSNVFCLKNLPEVIKGALFSKYSRSTMGLRSLLIKDFISNIESGFSNSKSEKPDETSSSQAQILQIKKAQHFYDRILDNYGDDSIGELGGAHIAFESVSMLAAKVIEDARIGGSPLEKSTRYIYFDQKVRGEYQFYREPIIMTSAYRDLYLNLCNKLFETYKDIIPYLTEQMEEKFPRAEDVPKRVHNAAIRAKVLDCLRGLLPASTLTNMGVFANGRFFETLIQKLGSEDLTEMRELGESSHQELSKVIPSFIRRSEKDHHHNIAFNSYHRDTKNNLKNLCNTYASNLSSKYSGPLVKLVDFDKNSPQKVVSSLLFANSNAMLSDIKNHVNNLSNEEISSIIKSTTGFRGNRRHKAPRAFEHAFFTFEIVSDFGVYRDLQRHRMLTQERQVLTCDHGYYIPKELLGTPQELKYREAMDDAKKAYSTIAENFPEEAQYIVPMAYNIHWYFHINLRSLQWLTELRSSPNGHPEYRSIAQSMAYQISQQFPEFKPLFKYVDFDGYHLGRLQEEIRKEKKMCSNATA